MRSRFGNALDAEVVVMRRCRSTVDLGCSSFGDQRTFGACSIWPPARLVSPVHRSRRATRRNPGSGSVPFGQTAGLVALVRVDGSPSRTPSGFLGRLPAAQSLLRQPAEVGVHCFGQPQTAEFNRFSGSARTLVLQPPQVPNPSVKGTSRKRAAPYLER
jgi:hypothetical protein